MTLALRSPRPNQPTGMRAFVVVWIGQVISLFGSALTAFALTIWAWTETGEATALALVATFNFAPQVLLSPIAGALVDRWNRKLVMMISDLGAGLSTVALYVLYALGMLELWHIYLAGLFAGASQAFQFPAYSAAVTMMLPKEQYARATGMLAMAQSASNIFAPALAAVLITTVGITGVMAIDIMTFVVAVGALAFVHIPQPVRAGSDAAGGGSLWRESIYGFQYILARPSLLGLQTMFFLANLFGSFFIVLSAPMVLARTGNNELVLGAVQSALSIGGLVGGLIVSVWGGPKRRVHGVLLGMIATSLFGQLPFGLGQVLPAWAISAFLMFLFINVLNASNQAIWQAKVAPEVQGRVFAARRLIAQITAPAAAVIAGPLADLIFEPVFRYEGLLAAANGPVLRLYEPLLRPDSPLAQMLGPLFGYGPGAGMGLLITLTGVLGALAATTGYFFRAIRDAETILPDHDAVGEAEAPPSDTDNSGGVVVMRDDILPNTGPASDAAVAPS
ncbi:MAG: MFS transporter [Chloroflexota bacterium]